MLFCLYLFLSGRIALIHPRQTLGILILGVILLPAGTSAGVIVNVDNFLPNEDVTLAYNEVAVFDVTGLVYQSV